MRSSALAIVLMLLAGAVVLCSRNHKSTSTTERSEGGTVVIRFEPETSHEQVVGGFDADGRLNLVLSTFFIRSEGGSPAPPLAADAIPICRDLGPKPSTH